MTLWFLIAAIMLLGFLLAMLFMAHVIMQEKPASVTVSWILALIIAPLIAVPLYILLGGRKTHRIARRKGQLGIRSPERATHITTPAMESLIRSYGFPAAAAGHRLKMLGTGVDIYNSLVEMVDSARESIYISTFILRPDSVGSDIVNRLAAKAAQGIDVCLLLDGVGSFNTSWDFLSPLTKNGGQVAFFIPLFHNPFRGRTNLRNHRKLTIVDGKRVLGGGTNIGMEYIGPTPTRERWKDLSYVLEGPAVTSCVDIFLSDWVFAGGKAIEPPPQMGPAKSSAGSIVQIIPSGPDVPEDTLYDAIVTGIFATLNRLWIVTPYFIPDEALTQAIKIAARRDVDVRIVMPWHSDNKLGDHIRNPYLREIQRAGGDVMFYMPGMLHGKVVIADDWAMVGSANMDIRSFFLNYEVAMFTYSSHQIEQIAHWTEELMQDCHTGIKRKVSGPRKLLEGSLRLLSPLA